MYAGGRPLWQLSIALHDREGPALVLRWSPTQHRIVEAAMTRIMRGVGTNEPLVEPIGEEAAFLRCSRQWRKPLRIDEINRMAPTPGVRERRGRP